MAFRASSQRLLSLERWKSKRTASFPSIHVIISASLCPSSSFLVAKSAAEALRTRKLQFLDVWRPGRLIDACLLLKNFCFHVSILISSESFSVYIFFEPKIMRFGEWVLRQSSLFCALFLAETNSLNRLLSLLISASMFRSYVSTSTFLLPGRVTLLPVIFV